MGAARTELAAADGGEFGGGSGRREVGRGGRGGDMDLVRVQ